MSRQRGSTVCIKVRIVERGRGFQVDCDPPTILMDDEPRWTDYRLPAEGLDLVELEKDLIRQALRRHDGNRTYAARDLGLTRQTLLYRMRKYRLR